LIFIQLLIIVTLQTNNYEEDNSFNLAIEEEDKTECEENLLTVQQVIQIMVTLRLYLLRFPIFLL